MDECTDGACAELACRAMAEARAANAALLQLVTEVAMAQGLDADGSATAGRYLGILGAHSRIADVVTVAEGTAFDRGLNAARDAIRDRVKCSEPILARIARARRG